jgi:hypothetical protein
MRLIRFALAAALLVGLSTQTQAADPTAGIDGNWGICQKAYTPSSGNSAITSVIDSLGFGVQISNGVVTATDSGNTFNLNLTLGNGAAQNADFSYDGYTMPGIYAVQNGVLTFAISFDGTRPTSLTDSTNYLIVVLAATNSSN